jgi:hypothetical protein
MNSSRITTTVVSIGPLIFALVVGVASILCGTGQAAETELPVTFSGGHRTDAMDGGRPVVLVAAALGVKPEVFREAFSGVTPARGGRPSPEESRRNKEALMKVLKPLGVSNERLERGELWKTTPA